MVLGIGFLLLVSLVISTVLSSLHNFMTGLLPQAQFLTQTLNFVLSFGIVTLLFAMIYKVLPDVDLAWKDVVIGAVITALLFTIGKFLLGLYLGNSSVASSYGVAGSFVVLLLWVYYSAQILLFGAEFTQVYARRHGSLFIQPTSNAVPVTAEQRAQEGLSREHDLQPEPATNLQMLPVVYESPVLIDVDEFQPEEPQTVRRRWSVFWIGLAVYNTLVASIMLVVSALRSRRSFSR